MITGDGGGFDRAIDGIDDAIDHEKRVVAVEKPGGSL